MRDEYIQALYRRFNTLCRVLIGCYPDNDDPGREAAEVSIPSVGS